jgi:hypothetical protein
MSRLLTFLIYPNRIDSSKGVRILNINIKEQEPCWLYSCIPFQMVDAISQMSWPLKGVWEGWPGSINSINSRSLYVLLRLTSFGSVQKSLIQWRDTLALVHCTTAWRCFFLCTFIVSFAFSPYFYRHYTKCKLEWVWRDHEPSCTCHHMTIRRKIAWIHKY